MIQHEIHRLRVQNLAAMAEIWHVAGRQHAGHVLFVDCGALHIGFSGKPVRARVRPREGRNHMIHADTGHFLCRLHRRADRTLCLVHGVNFAKTHPARPRGRRTDHPKTGLPGKRADALLRRIGAVETEHQTGDLGAPHVKDGHHATLHGRAPHVAHCPLGLVKLDHSRSFLPASIALIRHISCVA